MAVYVLRVQVMAAGARTALRLKLEPTSWYTVMRSGGL